MLLMRLMVVLLMVVGVIVCTSAEPHHPLVVRLVEILAVDKGLVDGLPRRVYNHLVVRMVLLMAAHMLVIAATLSMVRVGRPYVLGGMVVLMVVVGEALR